MIAVEVQTDLILIVINRQEQEKMLGKELHLFVERQLLEQSCTCCAHTFSKAPRGPWMYYSCIAAINIAQMERSIYLISSFVQNKTSQPVFM